MGEAKRRGTLNQRVHEARLRPHPMWDNAKEVAGDESLVSPEEPDPILLRRAYDAFVDQIGIDAWRQRRAAVESEYLRVAHEQVAMGQTPALLFEDKLGWYLFLCELAISDPYHLPTYYSARALPFMGAIGAKLKYGASVQGLSGKFGEIATKRTREPDGHIFEILVALSYAEKGWVVQFIPESPPAKTADMMVTLEGVTLHVECKRMSQRSAYVQEEENLWHQQWTSAESMIRANRQWLWVDVVVHVEMKSLTPDWFASKLAVLLPYDGIDASMNDEAGRIRVRTIDRRPLDKDLHWSYVKASGSKLRHLLAGDWMPENAITSLAIDGSMRHSGDRPDFFSTYVDTVQWACGATFRCDAEESIERKARDVKSTLSRAKAQLPDEFPSIVHIALETLEGPEVEERRMKKLIPSIEQMTFAKRLEGVVIHSFQPVDSMEQVMVIDETSSEFWRDGNRRVHVPFTAILPADATASRPGSHWQPRRS
ncbi:hypothetical protein PQQ99_08875 [Paraburkholderia sediminicola]|uniref:hypothetical protein n=1 Tax=Paraburkholderia sediminicola TaxID=458836 RepID=UPI0038BD6E91